ncbi:MAG TPA: DUF3089 domain-containing protein [Rudaea sp.]|nr:DUF3089 domain-containing protein [Rudaea sp.]
MFTSLCMRAALAAMGFLCAMPTTAAPKNDYANEENWLCRPGRKDACAVDLTATVVAAGGKTSRELFHAAANPPIDCFYVYPTVSMEPTPNADMAIGPEERGVVRLQFARFASKCRLYAPVYRQMTIEQLRKAVSGAGDAGDQELAYGDVRDAFDYYLAHDNRGRGFVLIGHSQGSGELTRLIQEEIDGKPLASQFVSAILAGTQVEVAKGRDTGGTFASLPLCRAPAQFGCIIVYNSFRATRPPQADALLRRTGDPAREDACVNPANPGGGAGELKAYFGTHGRGFGNTQPAPPWLADGTDVTTPFVTVPGMLSARCASNEYGTYLAIEVHADPSGKRVGDIVGDVFTHGAVRPRWGLHVIDIELAMGNLLDLVAAESAAWQHDHAHKH